MKTKTSKLTTFFLFLILYLFTTNQNLIAQPCNFNGFNVTFDHCVEEDFDGCFRAKYSFYFDVSNNVPSFQVNSLALRGDITGAGYIDEWTSIQGLGIDNNNKTFIYQLPCGIDPVTGAFIVNDIPAGDCNNPLFEITVVTEPNEEFNIDIADLTGIWDSNNNPIAPIFAQIFPNPNAGSCNPPIDICGIAAVDPTAFTPTPPACTSPIEIGYDIPAPFTAPYGTDPKTIKVWIKNTGASLVNVGEMDFRIDVEDIEGNIPLINAISLTGLPPEITLTGGGLAGSISAYYYNEDLALPLFPGDVSDILEIIITPPLAIENEYAEVDLSIDFARIEENGSNCCSGILPSSVGTVIFEGESFCEPTQTGNQRVNFSIGPSFPAGLGECEVAFSIEVTELFNANGGSEDFLPIERLFLELETETTGSTQISDVRLSKNPPHAAFMCVDAAGGNNCPANAAGDCIDWDGNTMTYSYCRAPGSNPAILRKQSFILVTLYGLNGCLSDVKVKQAVVQIEGMLEACIPIINPVVEDHCSGCEYCPELVVEIGPYAGTLGNCEEGFSVYLNNQTSTDVSLADLGLRFTMNKMGDINIGNGLNHAWCPLNSTCVPNPPPDYDPPCTELVESDNTTPNIQINHQFCGATTINISANQSEPALNVKFTDDGTISSLNFIGATMRLTGGTTCEMYVDQASIDSNFPKHISCNGKMLAGEITKENEDPIAEVDMLVEEVTDGLNILDMLNDNYCLADMSPQCSEEFLTPADCTGAYNYDVLCQSFNTFVVTPDKKGCIKNGVTVFDQFLIMRHILNTVLLDSPYKIIGANVNNSGTITVSDIVAMARVNLAIEDDWPAPSWRFVPKDFTFTNNSNPFLDGFPECRRVDFLQNNPAVADFYAIKVGDMNLNADGCEHCPEQFDFNSDTDDREAGNSEPDYYVKSPNKTLKAGDKYSMPVDLKTAKSFVAWQMSIKFDTDKLKFNQILNAGTENFSEPDRFGLTDVNKGIIRAAMIEDMTQSYNFSNGKRLFEIEFEVLKDISDLNRVITLNYGDMLNAFYEASGKAYTPGLIFENASTLPENAVISAIPNPFKDRITFSVNLPETSVTKIRITDLLGREVANWSGNIQKGNNTISFENTANWEPGVFIYTIETEQKTYSGKIIRE